MMTNDNDPALYPDSGNEELRAIYHSAPRESAPRHLDKIVMRSAATEVQKDASLRWFLPWRRPIAFMVTAGLCLAVVIEMNDAAIFEQNPLGEFDTETEFAAEAVESSARMREIGRTATHLFLGQDPDTREVTPVGIGLCSDAQIETPESWLKCIAQLREDGSGPEADAELDRFRLAYPDFPPAE